jgi:hypothetical protein
LPNTEEFLEYLIATNEKPLITAAIDLGDWITAQREISRKQRKIINEVQQALRQLPRFSRGVTGEYGFQLRNLNGDGMLYRAWRVSLSPAGLEIYSVYSPDRKIELTEKMSHELNFWIRPGETSGHNGHYLEEWIDEVSDPDRFKPESIEFGIYASYFD